MRNSAIGQRVLRGFLTVTLLLFLLASLLVIAGGAYLLTLKDTKIRDELLQIGVRDRTTRLYATNAAGEEIELVSDRISGYENALYCPLSEMPEALKNAFIAIEDKRFYEHGGIDWQRTAAATLAFARGGGSANFGGSTITQQLDKNLTGDSEKSLRRKAAELLRAANVEKRLSKESILEQYLNVVNLAQNCYGVRTAANAYFSKEPRDLTLAECATLAAITNNPSRYDPIRNPENNRVRRDLILSEMKKQGMIDEAAYREAVAEPIELSVNERALSGRVNSWYADMAVADVISALQREKGMTKEEASHLVYCGGLRIYTAMDVDVQEAVSEFYRDPAHFPTHKGEKKAESALMIVSPESGRILAVAGAVGEKSSNRIQNYATDTKRPSGSVIKPLSVYAPALEANLITYASVFDDVPLSFRENGAPWPKNAPNVYRGLINVNEALTHSVNTVAVSVLERLGKGVSYRFLTEKLGFTSLDAKNDMGAASLALGQQYQGVTLREVVGGYTALANGGVFTAPVSYLRVVDSNGKVLLENEPKGTRVLSEDTASIMTMMLRHVVSEGTGQAVTLKKRVDVAGKTGTSSNSCDKWFVGYTPELLCGVWYGYAYPESVADVRGNHALAIFDSVMFEVLEKRPPKKLLLETAPSVVAVRYCKDSGKLLSDACGHDPRGERSEIGYFKQGTVPTAHCTRHVLVSYCRGKGVACEDCPPENCYNTALLWIERHFPRQIRVLDAPYTYGGVCRRKGRELTNNEPYYANFYDSKQNFGIEMGLVPYNRMCDGQHGEAPLPPEENRLWFDKIKPKKQEEA